MDVRLTKQASGDIDAIIAYTDETFGEAQTEEYLSGLYRTLDVLGDNPEFGRQWARGRRCYIYRQHYVFYRIRPDHLLVTHIRHTRMRIPEGWK